MKFRETLLLTLIVASPELLAQASRGYAGEDGGRGGNAGDGGDGGDLTVFFTNEIDLKDIKFISRRGSPGYRGRGGRCGYGCPSGADGDNGHSADSSEK